MTKFITYYNLCSIHDPNEFLGISADREEGKIITTLGKNIVVVIQVNNQKQIRSWSTLEKLSSKVVYDHKSQKYVGVFANRSMRCWDESTADINKCKKLKFNKSIADLVVSKDITLVIYTDGTCEDLASAIQSRKNDDNVKPQLNVIPQSHTITNAKICYQSDGKKCLTWFEKDPNSDTIILVKVNFESGLNVNSSDDIQKFVLKRENLNVKVAGYSVIDGDDGPMLLTIWSDKRIFLLNLDDSVVPEKSPGNFVSMLNAVKVDSSLSIIGVSKHFIAIYGPNSSQEGAFLLLYNTQFKVIKAKQFFKIYFNFSHLWAVNGNILLAMGQNLSVVSYSISKELLSEFVGTQSSNDFQTAIENDHINEEEPLQESIQFSKSQSSGKTNIVKTIDKKSILADGKSVPFESISNFEKDFNALSKLNMHVDVVQVENSYEDIQVHLMSNIYDDGFTTNEAQMIARQLELCGASEHEITEKLLVVLMKANLLHDIAVCIRRYTSISENMLARVLKYVLNNLSNLTNNLTNNSESNISTIDEVEDQKNVDSSALLNGNLKELPIADIFLEKYKNVPEIKDYADVLNIVLCCDFDAEAIATYIRKEIDYPQVIFMLEYLYTILTSEHNFELEIHGFGKECIDVELQVFRWFGVFINTHFQTMAFSKDAHLIDILFKWHELFSLYKQEITELEHVSSLLQNIVNRKKVLKEKKYSKWYSIEEVNLY